MIKKIKVHAYRKNGSFKIWFYLKFPYQKISERVKITKAAKEHECFYCGKTIFKGTKFIHNDHDYCTKQCMEDHYNKKHFIQLCKMEVKRLNKEDKLYCREHNFSYVNKYKITDVQYKDWSVRI